MTVEAFPQPPDTDTDTDTDTDETPDRLRAAPDSPLAGLRARRQSAVDHLHIDLKVPRWDDDGGPAIYVRYRPIDPTAAQKAVRKRERVKPRPDDYQFLATLDVLVGACDGVYAVDDPDNDDPLRLSLRDGDPHGKWTKFDPDLAYALGLGTSRATDVVFSKDAEGPTGLYLTEGDVFATFNALSEWSGLAAPVQADEAFRGN